MDYEISTNFDLKNETLISVMLTLLEVFEKKRVLTKWVYGCLVDALFAIRRRQYNSALHYADLAIAQNIVESERQTVDQPILKTLDNILELLTYTVKLPVIA